MSAWVLVPAVLLALGLGVLVGRAVDDDAADVASNSTSTSSSSSSTSSSSSSSSSTVAVTADSTTTTVRVVTAAPQTASTTTPTTRPASATPAAGATATTSAPPSNPACGAGSASASAKLAISGSGPPSDPRFTYSGPVTVANNTDKAIEVDSLVIRLSSSDGTNEDVPVSGAPGTVIAAGATRDFGFSYTTSHPPKEQGAASVSKFSYRPPGQSSICAST